MIATLTHEQAHLKMRSAAKVIFENILAAHTETHCLCLDTMLDLFRTMYDGVDLTTDIADFLTTELQMKRVEIIANEEK